MIAIQMVAGPQLGIAHVAQLSAAGVGSSVLSRLVASGFARRVHPGVYSFGAAAVELSPEARMVALQLYLGPDSAISHSTAAHVLGCWDRPGGVVHASTTQRRAPIDDPGTAVHRSIHPMIATSVLIGNVRVTNPARTFVEVGQELTCFQCCRVLGLADFAGLLQTRDVERLLDDRRGEAGTAVTRTALRLRIEGSAGSKSRTEDRGIWLLDRAGVPEPLVNNRLIDGLEGNEPDLAWRREQYIAEIDGRGHSLVGMQAYDHGRMRLYEAEGWLVRRFCASVLWDEPEHFVSTVIDDLRMRRGRSRRQARRQ